MAQWAVKYRSTSIRFACRTFSISETCYRYQPRLSDENELIADWLVALTDKKKMWGFGLCYLHLRNVKGFRWNHKRVFCRNRSLNAPGLFPSALHGNRDGFKRTRDFSMLGKQNYAAVEAGSSALGANIDTRRRRSCA